MPAESPNDWENVSGLRSHHAGGVHIALADSTVRFVGDDIALDAYRSLATIAGHERARLDDLD